jgi:hypothetical protein
MLYHKDRKKETSVVMLIRYNFGCLKELCRWGTMVCGY